MLRKLTVVLISAGALALAACSSSSSPPVNLCNGVAAPCTAFPAGTAASTITTAIATAAQGTTFVFGTGTFAIPTAITVPAVSGITITGTGMANTILDFSSPTSGTGDGIDALLGNTNLTFSNLTVQNATGDDIKVLGGNGVSFLSVNATWTNPNVLTHGSYGLYPVQSQSILMDSCQASGARDTGMYIGQSYNIIVRNGKVSGNVAGIEIESSVNADVYGNEATGNSGGILVFALPTLLPPPGTPNGTTDGTADVRVFNNNIHDNTQTNFGDPAGTVALVPAGTGSFVLAGNNVEIYGNTFTNNPTVAFAVVSYFVINASFDPTDPNQNPTGLNPFSNNVYVHDNTFTNNGTAPISENEAPDGGVSTNELGALLAGLVLEGAFTATNNAVPALVWDGIADEDPPVSYVPPTAPTNASSAGTSNIGPNPVSYFIGTNTGATFGNLNFPVLVACGNASCLEPTAVAFNATPFTVSATPQGFPLPGVPDAGAAP